MSSRIQRRRFLADLLFAGGAVSLASMLAQAGRDSSQVQSEPEPSGSRELPDGEVSPPKEPPLAGKPAPPRVEKNLRGRYASPRPKKEEPPQ